MLGNICGDTSHLVAYYPFNQGIAGGTNTNVTTADDVTSNNNDGNLTNFTLRGSTSNWVTGVPGLSDSATFYKDADEDGYGNKNISVNVLSCNLPAGYVLDNTDCNDANASIHPFAKEICNGIDDNCNGLIDEITGLTTTNITATTATFNWHALQGSRGYIIKYKLADPTSTTWSTVAVNAPVISVTVSKLHSNSKYLWKIASNCGTRQLTAYSGPVRFKTAAASLVSQQHEEPVKGATSDLIIYPNPVTDILHLDNLKGTMTIFILTSDGRMVDKKIISNGTYAWNVKSLVAGTYYMRIEEGAKVTTLKFIKQ